MVFVFILHILFASNSRLTDFVVSFLSLPWEYRLSSKTHYNKLQTNTNIWWKSHTHPSWARLFNCQFKTVGIVPKKKLYWTTLIVNNWCPYRCYWLVTLCTKETLNKREKLLHNPIWKKKIPNPSVKKMVYPKIALLLKEFVRVVFWQVFCLHRRWPESASSSTSRNQRSTELPILQSRVQDCKLQYVLSLSLTKTGVGFQSLFKRHCIWVTWQTMDIDLENFVVIKRISIIVQ